MKSFFEEYGFVILAAIVVILLIAMASPIGDLVKAQITGIVDSFANKTESKLNAVDAGAITVRVTQNNASGIKLEWDAEKGEDKFFVQYRASNTKSETNWMYLENATGKTQADAPDAANIGGTAKANSVTITHDTSAAVGDEAATNKLQNGTKVEYKVYDSNKVVVASGTVVARV